MVDHILCTCMWIIYVPILELLKKSRWLYQGIMLVSSQNHMKMHVVRKHLVVRTVHTCCSTPIVMIVHVHVHTVIWFYFVLYLISYAAVRTKIKRTNIFQQLNFHI